MARRYSLPEPFCLFDMIVIDWSPSATGGIRSGPRAHASRESKASLCSRPDLLHRLELPQRLASKRHNFYFSAAAGRWRIRRRWRDRHLETSPSDGLGATDTNIVVTLPG